MKIAVLGCGGWGLAIAVLLQANGHSVTAWGRDSARFRTLQSTRASEKLLPGITLPEGFVVKAGEQVDTDEISRREGA